MSDPITVALDMIQKQIRELDALYAQAAMELNTVAGKERVAKWKARTVALLAQHLGQKEGQRFAEKQMGPSFSADLVEELGDEVEIYRDYLTTLSDLLTKHRSQASGTT